MAWIYQLVGCCYDITFYNDLTDQPWQVQRRLEQPIDHRSLIKLMYQSWQGEPLVHEADVQGEKRRKKKREKAQKERTLKFCNFPITLLFLFSFFYYFSSNFVFLFSLFLIIIAVIIFPFSL